MRKLGILLMAMLLVVSMSLVVMADTPSSEDDAASEYYYNESDSVKIKMDIPKFASLEFTGGDLNLNFDQPRTDEEFGEQAHKVSDTTTLTVESNAPVKVQLKENMSLKLAKEYGWENIKVGNWGGSDEEIFAPFMTVSGPATHPFGDTVWTNPSIEDDHGIIVEFVHNAHRSLSDSNSETVVDVGPKEDYQVFYENKWYIDGAWSEVKPGEKEYTLTATIAGFPNE